MSGIPGGLPRNVMDMMSRSGFGDGMTALAPGARKLMPAEAIKPVGMYDSTPLEYALKTGNVAKVKEIIDRDIRKYPKRWDYGLFELPPPGKVIPGYPEARAYLVEALGRAGIKDPHNGFVMPPRHPDQGLGPHIKGPLAAWRAEYPDALVANVSMRHDLVDADFVHLAGIKAVDMRWCNNPGLTSAAFAHLRGVHTLWMDGCNQESIGDAAFAHLRGVHTLYMGGCVQDTLTDGAFVHLRGVHTLKMNYCTQPSITGATLSNLRGVRSLQMAGCKPAVIAAARALNLPVDEKGNSVIQPWPEAGRGGRRKTRKTRRKRRYSRRR